MIKCYNCCFYSSFIFLLNSILAFYYEYYVYAFLFLLLVCTSLIFHSTINIYTNLLDKISIFLVVLYGSYLFYTKLIVKVKTDFIATYIYAFFIINTFLITIYLFYYGYFTNNYCYSEDLELANNYHSLMHFISSFGHICIIFI
jgi:hypothetical protein